MSIRAVTSLKLIVISLALIAASVTASASEICFKYMEADSEFSEIYSERLQFGSNVGSLTKSYATDTYLPAIKKYGEAYRNAYPGDIKPNDDEINLKRAITWRIMACPGDHLWHANIADGMNIFRLWTLFVHMDEGARIQLACRNLTSSDRRFEATISRFSDSKNKVERALLKYASNYIGAYIKDTSELGLSRTRDVDLEDRLRRMIEFRESNCSGEHKWTDTRITLWKNSR